MVAKEFPDPSVHPVAHTSCYGIFNNATVKIPVGIEVVVWILKNGDATDTSVYRFEHPAIALVDKSSFEKNGFDNDGKFDKYKWRLKVPAVPSHKQTTYNLSVVRYKDNGDFVEVCEPTDPIIVNQN